MTPEFIPFQDADHLLDWHDLTDAITSGHQFAKAKVDDTFLYRGGDTLLSRSAWIDGMGIAVKTATIFPNNDPKIASSINGGVSLYSDKTGELESILDFHLVTKWKTAGDSLLAAKRLARSDSKRILIVGAGTVATSLRDAYGAAFPDADFMIWNRTHSRAAALAARYKSTFAVTDLEDAVRQADIVTSATMGTEPLIKGDWLQAGQHIDLIGAYRPDMRETDDSALKRARIFVDSRETTINHIGELKTPIENGVIGPEHIVADFYELGRFRRSPDDITLFKNGGGAHLDLMVSRYISDVWAAR